MVSAHQHLRWGFRPPRFNDEICFLCGQLTFRLTGGVSLTADPRRYTTSVTEKQ